MAPIVENLLEPADTLDSSARLFKQRAAPQIGVNRTVAKTAGHLVALKLEVFQLQLQQPPQPRQLLLYRTKSCLTRSSWMRCSRATADVAHHWAKCSTTKTGPSVRDRYSFELRISNTKIYTQLYCIVCSSKHDECSSVNCS